MNKIHPIIPPGHRVLLLMDDVSEQKEELKQEKRLKDMGFEIVSKIDEQQRQQAGARVGTVIAIGPSAFKDSCFKGIKWVNIGDKVYCERYAGSDVFIHGTHYKIINDDDFIGIVNPEYESASAEINEISIK